MSSVIEPVEHEHKAHVEEEDLEPVQIHVAPSENSGGPEICAACARPTRSHSSLEAFKCMMVLEERGEALPEPAPEDLHPYDRPGRWYMVHTLSNHEKKVEASLVARLGDRLYEVVQNFPGYVLVRCDLDDAVWHTICDTIGVTGFVGGNGSRPSPLRRDDVEKFMAGVNLRPPAPEEPPPEVFAERAPIAAAPAPVPAAAPPTEEVRDAWLSAIPFPVDAGGDMDVEKLVPLAAAMRVVLERERDEIIRRGGPIEKQNIELKERLGQAIETADMWRRRAQINAEQRNTFKEQLAAKDKELRKARNELKGRKNNNHVIKQELGDILAIVQSTPGWTAERQGNGHWAFKKDGIFITDAASTGQGPRVNMATRAALRRAGLEV